MKIGVLTFHRCINYGSYWQARSLVEGLRSRGRTPTEEPEVLWNFEKFLISRDGKVVGRFVPRTAPDAPELEAAIEAELAK